MKAQLYFHNNDDLQENCFPEKHFQDYMKEYNLKEIEVYKAKRIYDFDMFYCRFYKEVCEKNTETCGVNWCKEYDPVNKKSGICKCNRPLYEPDDRPIILKQK